MEKQEMRREVEHKEKQSGGGGGGEHTTPLISLNHVSRLCRCVKDSVDFYVNVLGFVLIERPETFDFDGAWLFNYGIGIHLVESNDPNKIPPADTHRLDPMDNHISFQCEDMAALEQKLKDRDIKYLKRTVEDERGTSIDQLFFNDPDGFMIEICNCENLKIVPANPAEESKLQLPSDRHTPPVHLTGDEKSRDSSQL